jgi:hypothetical protein
MGGAVILRPVIRDHLFEVGAGCPLASFLRRPLGPSGHFLPGLGRALGAAFLRLTPSRGFGGQPVGFRDVSFLAIDKVAAVPGSGSSPRMALLGMVPNAHQGPDHNPLSVRGEIILTIAVLIWRGLDWQRRRRWNEVGRFFKQAFRFLNQCT